jgi:GAF domain-containing protein
MSALQEIAESVLDATGATRVTIRAAADGFAVAAEALAPGTPSVRGSRPNPGVDPVVERVLAGETVVDDAVEQDLAPDDPRARYRITAEIVTPVMAGGAVIGVLSVHETARQRSWSPEEVETALAGARAAAELIDAHA